MPALWVRLFGKFSVARGERPVDGLDSSKARELFAYLILFRDRRHLRESLAGLLWGDGAPGRPRKYLRQVLWQLQTALEAPAGSESAAGRVLVVEPDAIDISADADIWLDVRTFEEAYARARGVPGRELDSERAAALQDAADLYQGDLLEGVYQDWCLFERERLQNMYLATLDKLMSYCEARREYEAGLAYGSSILRYDRAREHTHRRLMRLRYLDGDRTGALRQYQRCVASLAEELGVEPSRSTVALYEQIKADRLAEPGPETRPYLDADASLSDVLDGLKQIRATLADAHGQVQRGIRDVETALDGRR